MSCFFPEQVYKSRLLTANGKHQQTSNIDYALRDSEGNPVIQYRRCRYCEGCRSDMAKEWTTKILHETAFYFSNEEKRYKTSFLTLTYNDASLPLFGSLDYKKHWTNFLKRLRKELKYPIRYYMIGEYGSKNLRPHYHAIIFGEDFLYDSHVDSVRLGNNLYISDTVAKCWTVPTRKRNSIGRSLGYHSIGEVTPASCAYVARYSMKKLIGNNQFDGREFLMIDDTGQIVDRPSKSTRYLRYNQETGEPVIIERERALMSRGVKDGYGGIGRRYFELYKDSIYRKFQDGSYRDEIRLPNGIVVRPPAYYDRLLQQCDPETYEAVKQQRQDHVSKHVDELTPQKLESKRLIFLEKSKSLIRSL